LVWTEHWPGLHVADGVAALPDGEHLKNHLGTQHGGARSFAVADAARGAAPAKGYTG
jgi:acyl-coenzyme A thioesterase PaaI-like protein